MIRIKINFEETMLELEKLQERANQIIYTDHYEAERIFRELIKETKNDEPVFAVTDLPEES